MLAVQLTQPEEACECPVTAKSNLAKTPFFSISKLTVTIAALVLSISAPLAASSVLACECGTVKVPAAAPSDVDSQKGYTWSLTPECQGEFHEAVEKAKAFCGEYQQKHPDEQLAIVSDIDETVLDNRPVLKDFSHEDWPKFFQWVQAAKAPKLKESADFLNWAREKGFFIYFITGRHERDRTKTVINLNRQGFNYDGLYLRTNDDKRLAETYKSETREKIEKMGFVIVENIGDQFSDLAGGHSVDCQKLPNRMYFIP